MRKQPGFTLIELVIVVVILGFLAVTAIPKFLDLTDQAKQANIEGMAGGFATAISLARAQWEAEGRPKNGSDQNEINYDGITLLLTTEGTGIRPGYVVGLTDGELLNGSFDDDNCIEIWENILQQPPIVSKDIADLNDSDKGVQYYVNESSNGANQTCSYYLRETLAKNSNGNGDFVTTDIDTTANYFTYKPATSTVSITIN